MKEALVIFARAPQVGQVKTRLIGAFTAEQVTNLYIAFLRDTFALMEAVQEVREELSLVLCYTPAEELERFEAADIDGCLMLAQRGTQLGERLENCCVDLFELGFQSIVVIAADSPTLPEKILVESFTRLQTPQQITLGPTTDGGFYLVGLNHLPPAFFPPIDWMVEQTCAQLQAQAAERGLSLSCLPEWYDIDRSSDIKRLQAELLTLEAPLRHTRRAIRELFRRT